VRRVHGGDGRGHWTTVPVLQPVLDRLAALLPRRVQDLPVVPAPAVLGVAAGVVGVALGALVTLLTGAADGGGGRPVVRAAAVASPAPSATLPTSPSATVPAATSPATLPPPPPPAAPSRAVVPPPVPARHLRLPDALLGLRRADDPQVRKDFGKLLSDPNLVGATAGLYGKGTSAPTVVSGFDRPADGSGLPQILAGFLSSAQGSEPGVPVPPGPLGGSVSCGRYDPTAQPRLHGSFCLWVDDDVVGFLIRYTRRDAADLVLRVRAAVER